MNENVLSKRICDYSKTVDIMQIIAICFCALVVPTFVPQWIKAIFGANSFLATNSQLIVGTIVNTALIMTAINLKGWKKIIGIVTLPSISNLLGGYVFKTASPFMAYMVPAIWLGNFALVYSYKLLVLAKEKNYFLAGVVGVVIKVAIIFGFFNIINAFGIFPEKVATMFKVAMGSTQAITSTCGVILSALIYYPIKKVKKV